MKKYRRTKVDGLTDLVGVVNDSASVNIAQPTGLEDGSVVVTTYNWQEYFNTSFTKVPGIKKLHYLRFDSASPRCISVKERAGSTEVKQSMLKMKLWSPLADELPPVLSLSGLSNQWQWYFYHKIQEFCSENFKDITCPRPVEPPEDPSISWSPSLTPPSTPLPTSTTATSTTNAYEPPAK